MSEWNGNIAMKIDIKTPKWNQKIFGDEIITLEFPFHLSEKDIKDALEAKYKFINSKKKKRKTIRGTFEAAVANNIALGRRIDYLFPQLEKVYEKKQISRATYYRIKKMLDANK